MRYATVTSWAEYFGKEEGVKISYYTILKKLRDAKKIGITARSSVGRILKNSFYSETDIRSACADLLQPLPQADEDGFFEKDGIKYGTIRTWSKVLFISPRAITSRFKQFQTKGIERGIKGGQIHNFFSEPDIRSVCADLLDSDLPQADKNGFFKKGGVKYGTIYAWSRVLPISQMAITRRLKQFQANDIKGKDKSGQVQNFYSESNIRFACSDLLQDLPQADKNGFFEKDGIKYGTANAWSKVLSISPTAIRLRLKKQPQIKGIKGKDARNRINCFYPEHDVCSVCADLLVDMPEADGNGFFEKDGIKYGTANAWSRLLTTSQSTIKSRLKQSQSKSIKGKDCQGKIYNFYSETDVRSACADVLQDLPQADKDGFFEKEGVTYGVIEAWSRRLSVSTDVIRPRLIKAQKQSIEGMDSRNRVQNFYSETDVRSACADILEANNYDKAS